MNFYYGGYKIEDKNPYGRISCISVREQEIKFRKACDKARKLRKTKCKSKY